MDLDRPGLRTLDSAPSNKFPRRLVVCGSLSCSSGFRCWGDWIKSTLPGRFRALKCLGRKDGSSVWSGDPNCQTRAKSSAKQGDNVWPASFLSEFDLDEPAWNTRHVGSTRSGRKTDGNCAVRGKNFCDVFNAEFIAVDVDTMKQKHITLWKNTNLPRHPSTSNKKMNTPCRWRTTLPAHILQLSQAFRGGHMRFVGM